MTEIQLTEACKRKESFAQRLLYDRYVDQMYLLCIRYVSSTDDAEEVLSDAFFKCFNNISKFTYQGEGSVRAWLSKIVVNECLMFLRKRKQLIIPIEESGSMQLGDDSHVLSELNAREIMKHVRALPTGYRTVLNLYAFEDRSHKEIAELLQITESTSKSQLFKARAMLRQKIKDG